MTAYFAVSLQVPRRKHLSRWKQIYCLYQFTHDCDTYNHCSLNTARTLYCRNYVALERLNAFRKKDKQSCKSVSPLPLQNLIKKVDNADIVF